jgi:hypothetical protein
MNLLVAIVDGATFNAGLPRVMIDDLLLLISLLQYETLWNTFPLEFSTFKHLCLSILLDFGVR